MVVSDSYELGFQHMTDMDTQPMLLKKMEKEGRENDTKEEGESHECISHNMVLQC
jgi:hypothetical protein